MEEFQNEIVPAIHESAQGMGADMELEMAARILFAGIYNYRTVPDITRFTGASWELARRVMDNCQSQRLWLPDGTVVLGEIDEKYGDLAFWLHATAAAGEIQYMGDGYFQALSEAQKNEATA